MDADVSISGDGYAPQRSTPRGVVGAPRMIPRRADAWMLPAAYASLGEHVFINQPIDSLVATSTLGSGAAATGAALYAIDKVLSNPTLLDSEGQRIVPTAHPG